jgi:acetolactate synthase-1/2/3 large subunit
LFAGELGFFNSPEQLARLTDSDLVLAVGTRLGDLTTHGYTFPSSPLPGQQLIHVHRDSMMLGLNYVPALALACASEPFLEGLAAAAPATSPDRHYWAAELKRLLAPIVTWVPKTAADGVVFGNVVARLGDHLAPDAIVAMDAGISAGLMYRYHAWSPPQILLTPVAGTMGWGMPAAVAAALRDPGRQVVCIIGDGGMLMGGMELAAASERNLPITIILANNASYGAIRLNLERAYPGRRTATDLHNPDFEMLARAFGCKTYRIEREQDIGPVLASAFAERALTLIEVRTSLAAALPRID